ncbi:hypothetical protein RMSM_04732 [Rhodopirellula maiorica SM1]|uniref:Uncharacterized protein n=1 Tax=Rhodopirellula maiorica SM1 TaxID=1265738 RepID=M5RWM8_9BACT|nr:hypothetical protein RMSM_04732 [Rhodopirellula maiorica SM1]
MGVLSQTLSGGPPAALAPYFSGRLSRCLFAERVCSRASNKKAELRFLTTRL